MRKETSLADLRIVNVGNYEPSIFDAVAEASEYRVFCPYIKYYDSSEFGLTTFALKRKGHGVFDHRYYYLADPLQQSTNVVLTFDFCACCFDTPHLDYLKTIFELRTINSMQIFQMQAGSLRKFNEAHQILLQWMKAAGFKHHWFLGIDRILPATLLEGLEKPALIGASSDGFLSHEPVCNLYYLGTEVEKEDIYGIQQSNNIDPSLDDPTSKLYLVFQRERQVSKQNLQSLFRDEILPTEERLIRRDIKGAGSRFDQFKTMVPSWINSSLKKSETLHFFY